MSQILDYFRILEISYDAPMEDITSSYRRLSKQYHPDVNPNPAAEETMKQLNIAYAAITERRERESRIHEYAQSKNPARAAAEHASAPTQSQKRTYAQERDTIQKSADILKQYFGALLRGDYRQAYNMLSDYDRRTIDFAGFARWRESVARVYMMRAFTVDERGRIATVTLRDGGKYPARKFNIKITERNMLTGEASANETVKMAVNENGRWRVFLGFRDLDEIANSYNGMFEEKRRHDAERRFEEHRDGYCAELDMLNTVGLLREAAREVYRQRRYGGVLTAVCIAIQQNARSAKTVMLDTATLSASETIKAALRETDLCAYAGDGVFFILYVELKKRAAGGVINRLHDKIEQAIARQDVTVRHEFTHFSGSDLASAFSALKNKINK